MVKAIINIFQNSSVHSPSLKEIEKTDAVFILGEDLTNTAPLIALALRQLQEPHLSILQQKPSSRNERPSRSRIGSGYRHHFLLQQPYSD